MSTTNEGMPERLAKKVLLSDELKKQIVSAKRTQTGLRSLLDYLGNELDAADRKALEQAIMSVGIVVAACQRGDRIKKQADANKAQQGARAEAVVKRVFAGVVSVEDRLMLIAATSSWRFTDDDLVRWQTSRHAAQEAKYFLEHEFPETIAYIARQITDDAEGLEHVATKVHARFEEMKLGLEIKYSQHIAAIKDALATINQLG